MMYILFKMFRTKNFVHFNLFQLKFDMNRRKLSFDKVILLLVELFKTHCDVGLPGYCTFLLMELFKPHCDVGLTGYCTVFSK